MQNSYQQGTFGGFGEIHNINNTFQVAHQVLPPPQRYNVIRPSDNEK